MGQLGGVRQACATQLALLAGDQELSADESVGQPGLRVRAGMGQLGDGGRAWATQLALLALGAGVLQPPDSLPTWLRTLLWAPPTAAEPADMISMSDGGRSYMRCIWANTIRCVATLTFTHKGRQGRRCCLLLVY